MLFILKIFVNSYENYNFILFMCKIHYNRLKLLEFQLKTKISCNSVICYWYGFKIIILTKIERCLTKNSLKLLKNEC